MFLARILLLFDYLMHILNLINFKTGADSTQIMKEVFMFRKISLFVAILLLVSIAASCATSTTVTVTKPVTVQATSTVNPTVTSTVTAVITAITIAPTPTATGTPSTNAGDLAALGESKYEANCTFTYCHASFGPNGASGAVNSTPAEVAFGKTALSYFGNAQALFVFVKSFMHEADTKINLTDDEYVQVLAYLLVKNGTLTNSSVFGLSNLSTVLLKP